MRKCTRIVDGSLSELNVVPLLDLAFVLLVIFIITTTPVVNDLALNLPTASIHPKDAPRKANYVTVETSGAIFLNKKRVGFDELRDELVQLRVNDPDLNVIVRADGRVKYRLMARVMEVLQQVHVFKVELATEAADVRAN
jgi:biopolymer transport protein ExbD